MADKAAYQKQVQMRLNSLSGQINQWRNMATGRPQLAADITNLDSKRSAAERQLAALRSASNTSWEGLRGSIDAALNDLQNAVNSSRPRFL
ncbi:MAG: hypothetical protein H7175_13465 [Burkholderiales bacterium]|nr:hypothetical protein [Anaerolineae bacterium]